MVKKRVVKKDSDNKSESMKTSEKRKSSYLLNIQELFFKPDRFLQRIYTENRYQVLIKDFTLLYILYFIVSMIVGLTFAKPTLNDALLGFVSTVIAALIFPFVIAGVVHLGVLAFKGKKRFYETYKVAIYTLVIMTVYSIIMVILQLIAWLIWPYDMSILQQIQSSQDPDLIASLALSFLSQPGAKVSIGIYAIVNIISIIHGFIFYIKGIKKFHEIKHGKAALAIILPVVILLILVVLVALLVSYLGG